MPTATIYADDFSFHVTWIVAGYVNKISDVSGMNCRRRQFMLTFTSWIVACDDLCCEHRHELSPATIRATATIHAVTRHIDVQAAWRRRDSDRHSVGFFLLPVEYRHRAIWSVLQRLDFSLYMVQLDSNSQLKEDPCVVSIDCDNCQINCAKLVDP